MGKRNKDKKKQRKGKGFESSTSRRGRDEMTGLYIEFAGEKLYSDRQYDLLNPDAANPVTRLGAAIYGTSADEIEFAESGGGAQIEFELSDNAIAMTVHSYGVKWPERDSFTDKASLRWALVGDFDFDTNGSLESGAVSESASWTYFTWDNRVGEYSSIDKGNPIKASGYDLFGVWQQHERVFDYLADYGDNLIEGGPKGNFYNFESSKYFQGSWWDNPFATNLI
jgi:hypothetical protein